MANRKIARIAGLWYLASIVLGVIGEFAGDSEPMSTIGYFCGLAGYICFIVVVLKLYELFHKVSRILAMLMVCFVVIGIVIAVIGEGFGFATVAGIFWGLWLLPRAILILKSNLIGISLAPRKPCVSRGAVPQYGVCRVCYKRFSQSMQKAA